MSLGNQVSTAFNRFFYGQDNATTIVKTLNLDALNKSLIRQSDEALNSIGLFHSPAVKVKLKQAIAKESSFPNDLKQLLSDQIDETDLTKKENLDKQIQQALSSKPDLQEKLKTLQNNLNLTEPEKAEIAKTKQQFDEQTYDRFEAAADGITNLRQNAKISSDGIIDNQQEIIGFTKVLSETEKDLPNDINSNLLLANLKDSTGKNISETDISKNQTEADKYKTYSLFRTFLLSDNKKTNQYENITKQNQTNNYIVDPLIELDRSVSQTNASSNINININPNLPLDNSAPMVGGYSPELISTTISPALNDARTNRKRLQMTEYVNLILNGDLRGTLKGGKGDLLANASFPQGVQYLASQVTQNLDIFLVFDWSSPVFTGYYLPSISPAYQIKVLKGFLASEAASVVQKRASTLRKNNNGQENSLEYQESIEFLSKSVNSSTYISILNPPTGKENENVSPENKEAIKKNINDLLKSKNLSADKKAVLTKLQNDLKNDITWQQIRDRLIVLKEETGGLISEDENQTSDAINYSTFLQIVTQNLDTIEKQLEARQNLAKSTLENLNKSFQELSQAGNGSRG
jgi:hypothetical protein